jgi:hypothetical protein
MSQTIDIEKFHDTIFQVAQGLSTTPKGAENNPLNNHQKPFDFPLKNRREIA